MHYLTPHWPASQTIKAYTTLKSGWGLHNPHCASSPSEAKKINEDLVTLLHLPHEPIWFTQKHTNITLQTIPENAGKIADACFTHEPNQVCAILTADCLPLLICNKKATVVAAIHAGWRGLASGIIDSTLNAINEPSDELLVWLGPAIGPQKFEVGADVYEAFTSKNSASSQAFKKTSADKWHADLYQLARQNLQLHGITQIFGGDYCTYQNEDAFFSYRRDKGITGRMASVIWISN